MKRLISYFLLITICVTTLFRFQWEEANAVVKDIYEAYSVNTVDAGMVYYIKDTPSPKVVYCFDSAKKQPPLLTSGEKLPQYTKLDYLTSTDPTTISAGVKEQIAALLYVGYPNDALGLQAKYQLTDDQARYYTQSALWLLIRGDKWFGTDQTYETEIGNYAVNNGFYGDGTIDLKGNFELSKKGDSWESDVITIEGTHKDSITFENIPSGIKIINSATDTEVTGGLKVGDSFYLTYTGDATNLSTFNITYKYRKSNVDFYKLINDTTGIDYQNLIGLEQEDINKNITFDVKNNSTDTGNTGGTGNGTVNVPQINATVTINKFEEGTINRVVGAVLRLYEGSSDQGILIKEWTTTNAAEIIKVEPGKTYTLVEVSAPEGYKIAAPITFKVEKNTVVNSTSTNIIEDNTDYVAFRLDDQMKYISDGVSKAVVYCINKDLSNPNYSPNYKIPSLTDSTYPHYRHWTLSGVSDDDLYENQTQDFKREQLAELLLAGYPNDSYGYKVKHSLSDYTAYVTTQMVLDEVLAGKTSYKKTDGLQGDLLNQFNYYNDLLAAYLDPKIDNSSITIDFFNWVEGTGTQGETYQNLVGVTPFSNDISMEVTMEDKIDDTIDITVEKVWEDNNQAGARPSEVEVQLYKDGQPYGNIVKLNESNGWKYQWNKLSASNTWTVDEVNVPEGYIKNITEKDNNFTITNTKITGKIEITKTDIADGTLLPNAGFKIYDENMNLIAEGYTDEKGVASFELGYGKYYYQEFDAPEGYVLDETLFPFEIKINGEVVKAQMTNKKLEKPTEENDSTNKPEKPTEETDSTNEPEKPTEETDSTNKPEKPTEETDSTNKPEKPMEENDSTNKPEKPNSSDTINDNKENDINNKLPNTGGVNSYIYLILGLIITLFGFKLFNIKYKYEK